LWMHFAVSLVTVPQPKFLSSFGRNRGRALRPYQQGLVENLLPKIAVDLKAPLAGSSGKVALEIGFGGGEHLLAQAAHHPETLWIGCEPFINGVAKCLAGIDAGKLTNIRLFTNDARQLLEVLPPESLDSVFILFPDPWPKARHNKRRLVNHETLAMLHRVHKPGGRLLIATDHVDYSEWILEHLLSSPHYRWTAERADDFRLPPADWTETKYQRKTTAEGREPVFMECVRG
jgi:tRNA (guanine-N7-)-methyltransferase